MTFVQNVTKMPHVDDFLIKARRSKLKEFYERIGKRFGMKPMQVLKEG